MKNKFYIKTYGCTANQNDSEIMVGILKNFNYKLTNEEDADYIIINSCGVKSQSEEKIIHKIKALSSKNKKLILAGCLTKINPERLKKAAPNFSAILDTKSIDKIGNILDRINSGEKQVIEITNKVPDKPLLPKFSTNKTIDIIQISEGCSSNCSFCGTKLSRGDIKSYRPEIIRESLKESIGKGIKEIHLTSQDMSAYGKDIGTNLIELLNSITKIEGEFLIRIGMMNPLHFRKMEIKDLVKIFKHDKLFKFLHLCLQSGSNNVLDIMKRGYAVEDFVDYIKEFRKEIPEITIWTDIIVGHPGEEEVDFNQTLDVIKKIRPDFVNVSSYGTRLGTKSSNMKQIPSEIKKERTRKLSAVVKTLSFGNNKKWIGWKGEALVDEYKKEKGNYIARNYAYKPIVVKKDNIKIGDRIFVEIVDSEETCLISK